MTEHAIEIRNLHKTYAGNKRTGPKEALKGIDLTIPQGSVFGLLGPNGAGKSTLINIMAGLVVKTTGKVRIWGFDQDENPRQSRAAIGVMPQELNIDPYFTPREALEVQAGLYGVPKSERRTDEILALIGLTDKAESYARTLSGGMRRRLLLGKALVHGPQVLVLDEPTAGVDIELRQMLWDNVRMLNRQGMTIILTTHYLEEAQAMCDEIAIIDRGDLIIRDTTDSILARMDAKTLLVRPASPVAAVTLPEGVTREDRGDGWLVFTYPRSRVGAGQILTALSAAGVDVVDLSTTEPDLEDAFLALTRSHH
jgi:ABC-2 type transport system ATP-binding protein